MAPVLGNSTQPLEVSDNWISGFTYCAFLASITLCAALQYVVYATKSSVNSASNQHFRIFQRKYFIVYFLALFGDWLQGPYIYKLYSHYGFATNQIAMLYVVGFSASVIFGTGTGVLADYFGRRKMCIAFCVTYSLCCVMKLFPNYNVLLLGRLLGGISTSLLFSVFESWYVYEHVQNYDFPKEWISVTFSTATFWNGVLAIIAGVLANLFAEFLKFGPVSPFVIAIPCFLCSCIVISVSWNENYGKKQGSFRKMLIEGLKVILSNPLILMLGTIQSLFESVMYVFVFLWTPVIDINNPPLGMIFSVFMVCIMIGSLVYQLLLDRKLTAQHLLLIAVMLSTSSISGCALATSYEETNVFLAYICFLILEIAVGIYFPAVGYLKSQCIPESHRANIMNWFRVPLNIITCLVLLWLHHERNASGNCMIFLFCSGLMLTCVFITVTFIKSLRKHAIVMEQMQ